MKVTICDRCDNKISNDEAARDVSLNFPSSGDVARCDIRMNLCARCANEVRCVLQTPPPQVTLKGK